MRSLTNTTAGATGTATATCDGSTGQWTLGSESCTASIIAPTNLTATDGSISNGINVSWTAVSGASSYGLQYRKQGETTWTTIYSGSNTTYSITGLSDEGVFEFRVRGGNAIGAGDWSGIETGYIRKIIGPVFVSQSGIPAKIGVGQTFSYSQIWKNEGSETWAGAGSYGTGPFNPADTSVWGTGFGAFPSGSTAMGGTVTTTLTAKAPATPGTYPLQRIFQKGGTPYGTASTAVSVVVIDMPKCTGVSPDVSVTYNPNATITATISGGTSVDSASIKVWGEENGTNDIKEYAASLIGSVWTATFPIKDHLTSTETKVNIQAVVDNSLFEPAVCATSQVGFQQLPVPSVSITPTVGTFEGTVVENDVAYSGLTGYVIPRLNGHFGNASVSLGAFNHLKVNLRIEETGTGTSLGSPVMAATPGNDVPLVISATGADRTTWTSYGAKLIVEYADPDAAAQMKVGQVLIPWKLTPPAMGVTATPSSSYPPSVDSHIQLLGGGDFSEAEHGLFQGGLRTNMGVVVRDLTDGPGQWTFSELDYAQLYRTRLVAVARVRAPDGVNLLSPIEYVSDSFLLSSQPPLSVSATDGTREDDVMIEWVPSVNDATIKHRIFRDETEITPTGGISGTEFIDVPPARGQVFNYRLVSVLDGRESPQDKIDSGHVPACRAARLIGAGLNADMTAINGMIEQWPCLPGLTGTAAFDAGTASGLGISGDATYRNFSVPVAVDMPDGPHVLNIGLESAGVTLNASRTYEVPFTLDRASITVNEMTILYNGNTAVDGLEADSIGKFGLKLEGGTGIGFAEPVQ